MPRTKRSYFAASSGDQIRACILRRQSFTDVCCGTYVDVLNKNFIRTTELAVKRDISRKNLPIDDTDADFEARNEICSEIVPPGMTTEDAHVYVHIWAQDKFAQQIFDVIKHFASVDCFGTVGGEIGVDYLIKRFEIDICSPDQARRALGVIGKFGIDDALFRSRLALVCPGFQRSKPEFSLSDAPDYAKGLKGPEALQIFARHCDFRLEGGAPKRKRKMFEETSNAEFPERASKRNRPN